MTDEENTRKRLGDFEIVRELGRGGMGIVYEARQVSLNRKVALKVISGSLGLSPKAVLRFQREAEAAGKLHHTNIVPIYATGDDDGTHYYAMELVEGPSLQQVIRSLRSGNQKRSDVSDSAATVAVGEAPAASSSDAVLESSRGAIETPAWVSEMLGPPAVSGAPPLPSATAGVSSASAPSSLSYFDSVATMIAGVADALDFAHENGVIHRDIKPANLLLSKDGRVSINDFGLARMLEQPGMTMSGEFVGSPLYMSPEQITAGRAPLDHRTDIYSLGATLYELLTLKPVFPGQTRDEVIAQVLHKEPGRPRRHNSKIPIDLETICMKSLEKDPDRRYQSAGQLAEDLRCFVHRHAISARRVGAIERAVRWARKNKALTAMTCVTLVVILAAATFLYHSASKNRMLECERERREALTLAMSGDFAGAASAVGRADALVLDKGWSYMVSGLVDLYRGDARGGLEQLRAAVQANPANVTAHSLLADALVENGLFGEFSRKVNEIAQMRVESDLEKLFKGYAIGVHTVSSRQGLDLMDEAIEVSRQGFPIARVLRATILVFAAQDRLDLEAIRAAERDVEAAVQGGLADNPRLIHTRLMAKLTELQFHRRERRWEKARETLAEAAAFVDVLGQHPNFLFGNHQRLLHHSAAYELAELDADAPAMESALLAMQGVLKDIVEHKHGGFVITPYAATHFRAGRSHEALEQLEQLTSTNDPYLRLSKIFLLMDDPVRRPLAARIARETRDEITISCMFLLGEHEEATRAAEERVETTKHWTLSPYDPALNRYQAGLADETQLLEQADGSEITKCRAYFHIGLRKLAEGERDEALDSLEKSASSLAYNWTEIEWARALVARVKNEKDAWPDWIRSGPAETEAK